MNAPHSHIEASSSSPHVGGAAPARQKPQNIASDRRPSSSRTQAPSLYDREREHSTGGWSTSSVGTGGSGPGSSVKRTMSKRMARGVPSALSGALGMGRKRDKHSLALLSIRDFLKGRNCYDCLPVSFRLVVLDTKLVVKPALDVMWQAGE